MKQSRPKAIAFFDGQNLFHSAKETFGYTFPNFDPTKLALAICKQQGWFLEETRFYTGVPDKRDNPFWHHFWTAKLANINRRKRTFVFSRPLKYRYKKVHCPYNEECDHDDIKTLVADEKGIDVRIAIDVVSLAYKGKYDVALIFSQDQDLSEVADEIRDIAKIQNRFIKIASAFPKKPESKIKTRFVKGIYKTDWLPFDKILYDNCIDPNDYRLKR